MVNFVPPEDILWFENWIFLMTFDAFLNVFDFTQLWLDGRPGNEYFWISHKMFGLLTSWHPLVCVRSDLKQNWAIPPTVKCKSRDIVANANFILGWKLENGIDFHTPVWSTLWKCSLCICFEGWLVWSLVLSRDRIEHICSLRNNIECLSQLPTPSTNTYNKDRWNRRGSGLIAPPKFPRFWLKKKQNLLNEMSFD